MKQTKLWLTTIATLLCSLTASAHDFEAGGIYYNITSSTDLTVEVTYRGSYSNSYSNEYIGAVTIPETITYNSNTYRVTSIGNYAFEDCSSITFITIPEGVTSIGNYVFNGCTSLKEVIIEDGSTTLSMGYNYCSYSSDVAAKGLFYDCPLEEVYLGRNLSYNTGYNYGYSPFYGKTPLTSVIISDSVSSIHSYAFYGCSSLTSITIPESVTSIEWSAFSGCSSLTSMMVAEGNTIYDSRNNCNAIIETNSNTLITGCSSTIIPESVTSIGNSAFSGCRSLASINIPESVTSIGNYVFDDCTSLKEISIEDGSTTLSLGYNYYSNYSSDNNQGLFYDCPLEMVYLGRNLSYDSGNWHGYSPFYNRTDLTRVTIGVGVTKIGNYAFYNCSSLTSIIIPEGITSIGNCAFSGCSSLTSINIPESVTEIVSCAFSGCSSLTTITIPVSVTSIGDCVFSGCTSLKEFIIEDGSTTLSLGCNEEGYSSNRGQGLFYDCPLEKVYLGRNLGYENTSRYGYSPFYNRTDLTSVTIGESVTSIRNYAFDGCTSLKEVIIKDGNTALSLGYSYYSNYSSSTGQGLFYDCPLETVYLGRNLSYSSGQPYGYSPFYNSNRFPTISFGDNVTSIPSFLFYNNSSLTSIIIPESVTEIGSYAFWECCVLHSVTIGSGVLFIGSNAFSTLEKVIWLTNTPPTGYTNAKGSINYVANEQYNSLSNVKVYPYLSSMFEVDGVRYVPVSPAERTCHAIDCVYDKTMKTVNIGETASFKGIAMKVTEVMPYTFYGNDYIKEVAVEHKGNIGDYAFYGCGVLDTIVLGNNVELLGDYAFEYCRSLQEIIIPNSVKSLGKYCFYDCDSLKSAVIGDGVTTINNYAFQYCSSLPTITVPQTVTTIGDYVFSGCSNLSDVIIADRTTALALGSNGSSALFADCPLDSVYIGGKITYNTTSSEGYSPFYRNTSLRTVVITDREEQIYANEFYGCTNLQNVTIGNGVKSIGNYAFSGCSSLEGFAFGSNMESIGAEAFSDCTSLTSITSHAAVPPTCGTQALDDINKWNCSLRVPSGYAAAYQAADQWKDFFFIEDVVEVAMYTLTFMVDGEVYHTSSLVHKAEVTIPDAPTKEGYTFSGWSEVPATMPAEDVTVSGFFTINKYLVTFKIGEEVISSESMEYGSTIVVPEAPEREGYTFDGWGEVAETVPAGDVTYEGSYSVNSYLLTYMVDGETINVESIAYGTEITLLDEPVKEGYTFSGWSEVPETMPAEDVTVSGFFTVNTYKVYYYVGEELVHTAEVAYGESIPEYVYETTVEGDEFMGWIGETYETMPAHDVTYTANITNEISQSTMGDSQLTIYDLNGRKIQVNGLQELSKGIYIVNGKKVVIK